MIFGFAKLSQFFLSNIYSLKKFSNKKNNQSWTVFHLDFFLKKIECWKNSDSQKIRRNNLKELHNILEYQWIFVNFFVDTFFRQKFSICSEKNRRVKVSWKKFITLQEHFQAFEKKISSSLPPRFFFQKIEFWKNFGLEMIRRKNSRKFHNVPGCYCIFINILGLPFFEKKNFSLGKIIKWNYFEKKSLSCYSNSILMTSGFA